MTNQTTPPADRLFALIASIPGSGSVDWCEPARALLAEVRADTYNESADSAEKLAAAFHKRAESGEENGALEVASVLRVAASADAARAASFVGQAPATDQTALRDRIAEAVVRLHESGGLYALDAGEDGRTADAVLAVLPATTDQTADRGTGLRDEGLSGPCDCGEGAVHYTTDECPAELRRMADETQSAAQPPTDDAQFGITGCTCRPWTRQEDPPRYLDHPGDTVDMISGWKRGTDCPHHAAGARQDGAQSPPPSV